MREQFEYTIEAMPEDDSPEGHFASGDDAADARQVAWINEEREWNVWAWCCVKVTARHPNIEDVEGTDFLGGCSYTSKEDFCQPGGYFDDMKNIAADELEAKLEKMRAVLCSNSNGGK